jgi:GTP-binding protein
MTKTRGTAVTNHVFNKYEPYQPELVRINVHGSLISYEPGASTAYGLDAAQERGTLFIGPGVPVYAGMVVGQNARDEDMEINVCRGKKLTNMRSKAADEAIMLTPPLKMTLELSLEYIGPDEQVEVTPKSIRIRKRILDSNDRRRVKKATSPSA